MASKPKKPVKVVKPHVVSFRLTSDEFVVLSDQAQATGLTRGNYAHRLLTGKRPAFKAAKPQIRDFYDQKHYLALQQLGVALNRAGNNLNQAVHNFNMTGVAPPDLDAAIAQWRATVGEIQTLMAEAIPASYGDDADRAEDGAGDK